MSESFDAQLTDDTATDSSAGSGVRDKLHDTADKMHDAADSLRERVEHRAHSARSALTDLDVAQLVQQHPWIAVAGALALGAFMGGGGGSRVAGATAGAAAGAGRGAADLASRATHAVGDTAATLAHKVADATPPQMKTAASSAKHDVTDTVAEAVRQLKGTVADVFHARIDEFVGELQKGIQELGGTAKGGGTRNA